jgi:hypothetical protein
MSLEGDCHELKVISDAELLVTFGMSLYRELSNYKTCVSVKNIILQGFQAILKILLFIKVVAELLISFRGPSGFINCFFKLITIKELYLPRKTTTLYIYIYIYITYFYLADLIQNTVVLISSSQIKTSRRCQFYNTLMYF